MEGLGVGRKEDLGAGKIDSDDRLDNNTHVPSVPGVIPFQVSASS